MARLLLASALALACAAHAEPARIEALEVNGLAATERFVVERELPWKQGDPVSDEAWELGLARLWNTGLFSRIDARREGARAVLDVEERFTLNPLFRFATVGTYGQFRLGASDNNVLGRFLEIGAQYERFGDFNGGQAWVREPRLFDRRVNGLLQVERLTRPRLDATNANGYAVIRALARLEASGEWHDRLAFSAGVDLLSDTILAVGRSAEGLPVGSSGVVGTAGVRFGRVDTVRLRQRSWQLQLRPAFGATTDPSRPRWAQISGELLWFVMAGEGWTFATRVQAGVMGDAPVQHRFFLGGLDLVRGFRDNMLRTRAFALLNFEVRYIAFDSTWLALVPAVFFDGAVARRDAEDAPDGIAAAGFGVRFLVPKLLNVGTRVDLAFPLAPGGAPLASFGVYQFF